MDLGIEKDRQEYTQNEPVVIPTNTKVTLSVSDALDTLFPEQKRQDKDIYKARECLNTLTITFSELEIKEILTDMDILASTWLDDFERSLFDGKTLLELIHEKGGLI